MSKIIPHSDFTIISNSLVENNSTIAASKALALFGGIVSKAHKGSLRLLTSTISVHHHYRYTAFARPKEAVLENQYKDMFLDIYQIEQILDTIRQLSCLKLVKNDNTANIIDHNTPINNLKQALENVITNYMRMYKYLKHMQLWAKTIGHHQCDFLSQSISDKYISNIAELEDWMKSNNKSIDKYSH